MGRQRYYSHKGKYHPPSWFRRKGLKIGKRKAKYKRKGRYITGRQLRSK